MLMERKNFNYVLGPETATCSRTLTLVLAAYLFFSLIFFILSPVICPKPLTRHLKCQAEVGGSLTKLQTNASSLQQSQAF